MLIENYNRIFLLGEVTV